MIHLLNTGTPGVNILRGLSTEILDHHIAWKGRETTLMVENHGQGYHPVTIQALEVASVHPDWQHVTGIREFCCAVWAKTWGLCVAN